MLCESRGTTKSGKSGSMRATRVGTISSYLRASMGNIWAVDRGFWDSGEDAKAEHRNKARTFVLDFAGN